MTYIVLYIHTNSQLFYIPYHNHFVNFTNYKKLKFAFFLINYFLFTQKCVYLYY